MSEQAHAASPVRALHSVKSPHPSQYRVISPKQYQAEHDLFDRRTRGNILLVPVEAISKGYSRDLGLLLKVL